MVVLLPKKLEQCKGLNLNVLITFSNYFAEWVNELIRFTNNWFRLLGTAFSLSL